MPPRLAPRAILTDLVYRHILFSTCFNKGSASPLAHHPAEVMEKKSYQDTGEVCGPVLEWFFGDDSNLPVLSPVQQQTANTNQQLQSSPLGRHNTQISEGSFQSRTNWEAHQPAPKSTEAARGRRNLMRSSLVCFAL